MTRRLVRLIGGVAAGQEMWIDEGKSDRLCVAKHPSFVFCDACKPDSPPPAGLVYEHYEEYELHLMRFVEGYSHWYGYPAKGASLAHAMNEMWHVYSKASLEDA